MVDLKTIEEFANTLIQEHCPNYTFVWMNAKTIHGQCNYTKRLIRLSKPYALVATQDQIFNTITHEIAHAIVGSGIGHGLLWKQTHRRLGGTGERCSQVIVPKDYNYTLTCVGGCWKAQYQRRPKTLGRICRRCRGHLIVKSI